MNVSFLFYIPQDGDLWHAYPAACFSVHVRGSEYIPFLGSEDTSFSLLGVPEIE